MSVPAFNVLTDPWIPLDDGHGLAVYASYVDLMSGTRDAPDLVHPRDDCRFFARMLLSALTQALFPAANAKELRERIEAPLPREVVLSRVGKVKADFELVGGPLPWMQSPLTADTASAGECQTRELLLDNAKHLLFRPAVAVDALCAPCAVLVIYGIQSFAPAGGRGYSPGVRGTPPITTLVVAPGSVRVSVWANTLHTQTVERLVYGADPARPWAWHADEKEGGAIGLVEGLFWKPRGLRLIRANARVCAACGQDSETLAAVELEPRQKRAGGLYRHPMSPTVRRRRSKTVTEERYRNLSADRPAWTGLADLVTATHGGEEAKQEVFPAPVMDQWIEQIARHGEQMSLLVLDYAASKASVVHRFVETFPLSLRLADRHVADAVRACVDCAEKALDALRVACVRVHMKTRPGDKLSGPRKKRARNEKNLLHDSTADFWQDTELAFWAVYEAAIGEDEAALGREYSAFRGSACLTAVKIFDTWSRASLADPSRVAIVADAGAYLRRSLPWPSM